jgi:4-hydroxy-tetrahydrodipicolinate synthase
MSDARERLHGVFAPLLVPMDAGGDIDEPNLRRLVDWLIDRGVHGLFPNGTTGEALRLTADERRRVAQVVCEHAGGRVPVIVGTAEPDVRQTLAAAEAYAEMGARAVAVVTPFYYKLSPGAVEAYFAEVAARAPLDVLLYHIPQFATRLEVAAVRRLAEAHPRVIGIKESSGEAALMLRVLNAIRPPDAPAVREDFALFTGSEALLLPMLLMGYDGGVHSVCNFAPEPVRRLYDLAVAARAGMAEPHALDEARTLQLKLLRLIDAFEAAGEFPEGIRLGAELRGLRVGAGRQPLATTHRARRQDHIRAIGEALEGLDLRVQG